jgi:iron(III) transport system ATP-binding protein
VNDGLEIKALTKSYGATTVLDGVDLTVPAGGLTAVIGRSGGGKTTMLRLIAGFDRADSGSIRIGDRPADGLPPERRRIGYVTQEGSLFPHLTVAGNITFGLPWRDRRRQSRVGELLELVGLDQAYGKRQPHQLSGGEQQRVALARALARRPDLVLLDEPFSALDATLRGTTRRAVRDALAATGTTTVLVTHDQDEALSIADRVALLRDGRMVQEGTPMEVYRAPVDPAVAAFLGTVCSLDATLDGDEAETVLGRLGTPRPAYGKGMVLIRPEQIVPAADGLAATVEGVAFHGHDGVITLRAKDTTLVARWAGHLLPEPGDEVRIALEGSAIACFPDTLA